MPRIRDVCPGPGSSKFLVMVEHVFVWEGCSAKQSCFGPDFFFFSLFLTRKACSWISKCYLVIGVNKEKETQTTTTLDNNTFVTPDRFLPDREVHFLKIFLTPSRWKTNVFSEFSPFFLFSSPQSGHFLEDSPHLFTESFTDKGIECGLLGSPLSISQMPKFLGYLLRFSAPGLRRTVAAC